MSLLRDLNKLGEDLAADADSGFLPVGFERKPVAIVVDVDTRGGTVRVNDTRSPDNRRGVDRGVPWQKRSGSAAPPNLVCDKLEYVAGVAKDAEQRSASKAAGLQRSWVALLRRAGAEIGGRSADALTAIADAMADPSALVSAIVEKGIELPIKPGDAASLLCTFLVDSEDPLRYSELQDWWATLVSTDAAGEDGVCQVTGAVGPIARKFDAVKLPGNQPTLISANFEAAERYSGSQSTGARISVSVAKRSHAALNWLLDSDAHHSRMGEATLVWWVPGSPDDNVFASLINDPIAEQVQALTHGLWAGRSVPLDDHASFRAVLFTVSTARVVIRSDQTVALAQVVRSLGDYFAWHQIPGTNGQPRYFPLRRLAEAATRIGKQGAQMAHVNRLQADLLTCAISGRPVPKHYLGAALRRCHAERTVPDNRAALISLILRSNAGGSPVDQSDAYRCGQIFAEYENLQYRAFRPARLNRTIGDTYLSTFMSHPGRVVHVLHKKGQHHLGKLRRGDQADQGAAVAIARRLADLNAGLTYGYPSALSIEQQAEFVLGYHSARNQHLNPPTKENTQ